MVCVLTCALLCTSKPWSMQGVNGVFGFLNRVWRLVIDERAEGMQLNAAIVDRLAAYHAGRDVYIDVGDDGSYADEELGGLIGLQVAHDVRELARGELAASTSAVAELGQPDLRPPVPRLLSHLLPRFRCARRCDSRRRWLMRQR